MEEETLPKKERRALAKEQKRKERGRSEFSSKVKKLGIWILILGALGGGGYYWLANQEILPPTDFEGHVEQNPPSHILSEPMPILIQKHMLEHADGGGPPGVVINYNCEDFGCGPDLVDQLAEIARQYPEFVYLAPYRGMSKKIAITRFKLIKTFDEFDKEGLIRFIDSGE